MSQAEMEALHRGSSSLAVSVKSLKEHRCNRCNQETFLQRSPQSQSFNQNFSRIKTEAGTGLAISQPGDALEQEADSIADAMLGQSTSVPSPSLVGKAPLIQRQESPPKSEEEMYKEGGKKLSEAFLETKQGKEIKDKALKLGKSFWATLPGKIVTGAAAAGVISTLAATNSELPMQVPGIPLDVIAPGLKVNITYEGPVRNPTSAAIFFSYKEQVKGPKKGEMTSSEKFRAETARIAEDQARFREGLKTPEKRAAEQAAFEKAFWGSRDRLGLNKLRIPGLDGPERQPLIRSMKPKKEEEILQRKSTNSKPIRQATANVHDALSSPGQPLSPEVRSFMEKRFGHDFHSVRVHTDSMAAESARAVSAKAYTVGHDIVFASGQFEPGTAEGRKLLAHELVHTMQQRPREIMRDVDNTGKNVTTAAQSFPSKIAFGVSMGGSGIKLNPRYWLVEYNLDKGIQKRTFNSLKSPDVWPQVTQFLDNNPDWNGQQTSLTVSIKVKGNAAEAINDVWNPRSANHYSFDCYIGADLIELRGIYLSYQRLSRPDSDFNKDYSSFQITKSQAGAWTSLAQSGLESLPDQRLSLKDTAYQKIIKQGDWVYIANPYLVDPWEGENAIYMGGDQFYGHPIGAFTPQSYARFILNNVLKTHARSGVALPKNIDEVLQMSYLSPRLRPRQVQGGHRPPQRSARELGLVPPMPYGWGPGILAPLQ